MRKFNQKENIKKLFKIIGYDININKVHKSLKQTKNLFHNLSKNEFELIPKKAYTIYLPLLDIEINYHQNEYILEGYYFAKKLKILKCANFYIINNRVLFQLDSYKCYINSAEELYILYEIFIIGTYNFFSHDTNRSIMIDIGMNVGLVSLFFAQKKNIDVIYAYEPFLPTLKSGIENILLNKDISHKIIYNNFGLGNNYRQEELPYSYKYKGNMGKEGIPEHLKMEIKNPETLKIEVKSVTEIISKIKQDHPFHKMIAKIDCEGSEYEIIDALYKDNVINYIDVIMMEWHRKGDLELINKLLKSQFNIFSINSEDQISGMIYAYNV